MDMNNLINNIPGHISMAYLSIKKYGMSEWV